MTKKQRIEHKIGNQLRKTALILRQKGSRHGYNFCSGLPQDGKYTEAGVNFFRQLFNFKVSEARSVKAAAEKSDESFLSKLGKFLGWKSSTKPA